MRRRLLRAAGWLLATGLGVFLVAASGIVPIKASSGHWAVTQRFLDFTKKRSVATHSLGVEAPPLDDPRLVVMGAGHYETGCHPCHGGPDRRQPRIVRGMTPHPPYMPLRIDRWKPEELFYIVKHGVKFTAMPAWPSARRDDEVWAVVAFLLELPELDAEGYRRLAFGPASPEAEGETALTFTPPEAVSEVVEESCARCHGRDGRGREGAFPRLAGQRREYLRASLDAYAGGRRHSGMMGPVAEGLDAERIRAMAAYYAALPPGGAHPARPIDPAAAARGGEIARRGIQGRKVPSCVDCHGPAAGPRNPAYPDLAGQPADYLVRQLRLFKEGRRGGSSFAHLMEPVVLRLEQDQMEDVAAWYASLAPDPAG